MGSLHAGSFDLNNRVFNLHWFIKPFQVTRILFQFIPLAVMVVLYIAIFVNLHQKARKLERTMTRGLRSASETSTAIATASAGLVGRPMLVRQVRRLKLFVKWGKGGHKCCDV